MSYELVYKSSVTPFFPICLVATGYTRDMTALSGVAEGLTLPIYAINRENVTHWMFPSELSILGKRVVERILASPARLSRIHSEERRLSKRLLSMARRKPASLFAGRALTPSGRAFLSRLFSLYRGYGYWVDVPGFLFQLYSADDFRAAAGKGLKDPSLLDALFSSPRATNYERALLMLSRSASDASVASRFSWLHHDYLGDVLDAAAVRKMRAHLQKELADFRRRRASVSRLLSSVRPATASRIKAVQDILYLYNERKKAVLNRVNLFIRAVVFYHYGKPTHAFLHRAYQMDPETLLDALSGHASDADARADRFVYALFDGSIRAAEMKHFTLLEPPAGNAALKGRPAFPGSAKGKVAVILNISQFGQFREGDILVAPFTTVSYLPLMRRAKAILTETGGITSHAAIVSRELKVPCIVGIPHLLATLKTGDAVEVDAGQGTVKKT